MCVYHSREGTRTNIIQFIANIVGGITFLLQHQHSRTGSVNYVIILEILYGQQFLSLLLWFFYPGGYLKTD